MRRELELLEEGSTGVGLPGLCPGSVFWIFVTFLVLGDLIISYAFILPLFSGLCRFASEDAIEGDRESRLTRLEEGAKLDLSRVAGYRTLQRAFSGSTKS